jgi:hypothetical protein
VVTLDVQLYFPREIFDREAFILMSVDMVENDGDRKPRQNCKDLELNVGFGVEMLPRIGVLEGAADGEAGDETFTISVVVKSCHGEGNGVV